MATMLLRHFRSLSLRTHLLLMACVLALPAMVLIINSGYSHREEYLHESRAKTQKLSRDIAAEQINLTAAAQQLAMVLAQLPQVQERRVTEVNMLLARLLALNPRYGNIVVTDEKGDVWASALPMKHSFSLREARTFRNTMENRRFSSGEYVVGKLSAKPTIGFGYPVMNQTGEIAGVIALNINFDHFNEMLQQAGLPAGSRFTLTDFNGIIINCNREPERSIGRKLNDDIFMSMVRGADEGSLIGSEAGDVEQIVSYRKLRLTGEEFPYLYIRAGVPIQTTLETAFKEQVTDMLVLSSFLPAALLLALLIGKYCFVDRINVLRNAALLIAEGNLGVRVSDRVAGGELGQLGRAFDDMAQQIEERERRMRDSEELNKVSS